VDEKYLSLSGMQTASWALLLVLAGGSALLLSPFFALSVLVGGLIAIASFRVAQGDVVRLVTSVTALPSAEQRQSVARQGQKGYLLKFWLRIGLIGVILLVLIKGQLVDVFGLLVGLSTVVLAITLVAFGVVGRYFFRGRR
jgi:hypothetical protein